MRLQYITLLMLSFTFLSADGFGQGCGNWMYSQYSTYSNVSNTNGDQIIATITVDGTISGNCPIGCNCSAYHTPRAYNVVDSTGGWQSGASSSWNSYISEQNVQEIVAQPGIVYTHSWQGAVICSLAGALYSTATNSDSVAGFTTIQHNYPRNPLPQPCRIASFFDAVRNARAHHAEDVVYDNANGGSTVPSYGTPVTAMEDGTVVAAVSGNGPASTGYPGCAGNRGAPGNYVKIKGTDGYFTIYFHMTPSVSNQAPVSAGQVIGYLDNSGCQSAAHLHVGRKDPSNIPVTFTIPCVNPTPTAGFDDGSVGDDVPDTI